MTSSPRPAPAVPADLPAGPRSGCPFDPAPVLVAARDAAAAPLQPVRLPGGGAGWLVTGHAEQRALLADPRRSSDVTRPGYPMPVDPHAADDPGTEHGGESLGFILMDDPEHHRLRRTVTAPFTVRRVEALRPVVRRIVHEHLDAMLAGPRPADLVASFALPVPSLVICELLGVPYADREAFQGWSHRLISRAAGPADRRAAGVELVGYLARLVARKGEEPGDDLLTDQARRVAAGEVTVVEAAQTGALLLLAGHETTANMIGLGTLALLDDPAALARMRALAADPPATAAAVEELLRHLTIVQTGLRRVVAEDVEVAGVTLRAGEGVVLAIDLGNRDPAAYADPDRLDLDRDARRHLAFGFGVHQCLGQTLARVELQEAYAALVTRLPGLRVADGAGEPALKHDGEVYGLRELPVTWDGEGAA